MKFQFDYKNFEPSIVTQVYCSSAAEKIYSEVPSDSDVSAVISKEADGKYRTRIDIVAKGGKFHSEILDETALVSVRNALFCLNKVLAQWRADRFNGVS